MRLVLLAATVRATSAALALPSVLTTRGHNATAYVVAAAPGGCGATPHLRVACGKPRRVFAEELPAAVLVTRCAFSKASCRCPAANNYAMLLITLRRFEEAKRILRKVIPVARRVLGTEHELTLSLREDLSRATLDGGSSANEKRKALQMLEDTAAVMRRVLGPAHPDTLRAQESLEEYRQRTE